MLSSSKLMAFVATSDAARAQRFYEGVLGLQFLLDDAFALVFDANGTMLRISKMGKVAPPAHTVLGWEVDDIRAAVNELKTRGVDFLMIGGFNQDDLGVWTAPDNTKVAWFKDPDGNTLSLTEFAARGQ
jgi:catechol 2,3-dioxygenase-like lactoylglutathione lyase family enzyme